VRCKPSAIAHPNSECSSVAHKRHSGYALRGDENDVEHNLAAQRGVIDAQDYPGLGALAKKVRENHESLVVIVNEEAMIEVHPVDDQNGARAEKADDEKLLMLRSSFGSWRGIVAVDDLPKAIQENRAAPSRTLEYL
jgi:hypothetical protein